MTITFIVYNSIPLYAQEEYLVLSKNVHHVPKLPGDRIIPRNNKGTGIEDHVTYGPCRSIITKWT